MTPDLAYGYLFRTVLLFLCLYALFGIVRAVRGPELCDRVLGVNMVGSAVIAAILTLTAVLGEGYLADVAVVYAAVNFVSVVILNRVYVGGRGGRK